MFVTKEFLRRETPDCLPRRENIYCIVIAMIGDPCRLEHMYAIAVKENADVVYGNFTMAHSDRMEEYILPAHDWQMDKTKALQAYVTYGWTTIWDLLTRKELYRKYNIFFTEWGNLLRRFSFGRQVAVSCRQSCAYRRCRIFL